VATEACFDTKNKSLFKKGEESLEKRRNDCIVAMDGDYIDDKSRISRENNVRFYRLVSGLKAGDTCKRLNFDRFSEA